MNWHPNPVIFCPQDFTGNREVHWIDSADTLQLLANYLSTQTIIAVDTEGHNQQSFLGMTCFIQVSTHDKDFLVDALALYQEIGPILGKVFSSFSTVKLFHDMIDIRSLQRDFDLFTCGAINMQEAFHHYKPGAQKISFREMVKELVGLELSKEGQLADWRVRPLCRELAQYAVNDSRLLLKGWHSLITKISLGINIFC